MVSYRMASTRTAAINGKLAVAYMLPKFSIENFGHAYWHEVL